MPHWVQDVGDWVHECGILGTGMWKIGYRKVGDSVQECARSGTGMWEIGTGMCGLGIRMWGIWYNNVGGSGFVT